MVLALLGRLLASGMLFWSLADHPYAYFALLRIVVCIVAVICASLAYSQQLEGIDCPELGQDFGTRAKQFTSAMVFGKDVQVKEYNLDRYSRTVARVFVEGKDLCLELLKAGLAWHYKRYSSDPVLAEAEDQARKAKAGLWSTPNPVPPWEYRKLHRRRGEAEIADSPLLVRDAVSGGDMSH
jgi:hypothetical protein